MSTSSVGSTPSLHDYSGVQVHTTTSTPLRRKRPPGPGSSLRTTPLQDPARAATYGSWAATSVKDSSSSLLRDHVLRSSPHDYLRIYCCKRLLALALLSRKRPPRPPRCTSSVIKLDRSSTSLLSTPYNGTTTAEYDYSQPLHDGAPHSEIVTTSTHCWKSSFIDKQLHYNCFCTTLATS
jgi:hypothetical protein